ncbi:hypothetical protein TRICI_002576 [Trichomonascus ciferrii]|uniref:Peptide hydrolase n=1 Tax=Trichomonascus ciferrii TaxID=44093 RepID=A0A642V678_9ASCO|nr:hypothetical protein TRICI_002576 [Trichomonascus ciferrii]
MKAAIIVCGLAACGQAFSLTGLVNNVFGWEGIGGALQYPMGGGDAELRLLEFSETERAYYTEEDKLRLKREGKNFIDVTDFVGHYPDVQTKSNVEFPVKVSHEKAVKDLAKNITQSNMRNWLDHFSSFHTRYYKSDTGLESSQWLHDQVAKIIGERHDIHLQYWDHSWKQKSLVARIEGSKEPENIVVVGAHQDSINLLFPSLLAAPGADDDGSGTVTTLEVFRLLAEHQFEPENTVEFHWYSAEEGGLLGSQDIFTNYSAEGKTVKAMLQQDMTGYIKGTLDSDKEESLGVITDYVDESLTEFIKLVVDSYCDIPYVETSCGYGCSDHASASKAGYPSAFVIESDFDKSNHFIHSTMDTLDRLSFDHMEQHAKLTLGYAYELGFNRF